MKQRKYNSSSDSPNGSESLAYREARVKGFYLLVVEKEPGEYRLYVGVDGTMFCHYDTGSFDNLDASLRENVANFDPTAFLIFPIAPLTREEVIKEAPHSFDDLERYQLLMRRRRARPAREGKDNSSN